jgi:hypothetical protein
MSIIASPELSEQAYDILVAECAAPECGRQAFCEHHNASLHNTDSLSEWRFDGNLGYGSKFKQHNGQYYVAGYPEDMTPERWAFVRAANRRLDSLFASKSG